MKRTLARRRGVAAAAIGAAISLLMTAAPAHAVLPGTDIMVAAGGSDTTDPIMTALLANTNWNPTNFDHDFDGGTPTVNVKSVNIPAFLPTPKLVEGDSHGCANDVSWVQDPLAPGSTTAPTKGIAPFGSTAGRNYLAAETDGTGPAATGQSEVAGTDFACIDVARSSSAASGSDPAGFEYYAFALDAVGWATPSLKAPPALTRAQIIAIYDCVTTDWSEVGGLPGPIQRYIAQSGSGTRRFFITDILGKVDTNANPWVFPTSPTCPAPVPVQESDGSEVANADIDKAILPYSSANWAFQEKNRINPTIDRRKGTRMGAICCIADGPDANTDPDPASTVTWSASNLYRLDTTLSASSSGVVKEDNVFVVDSTPEYPGIRYVYNVIDNTGNRPGYQAAFALLGFENVGGSTKLGKLCQTTGAARAAATSIISTFGYAALNVSGGLASTNLAGSTCRRFS